MKKIMLFIIGFLYITPIWGQNILNLSTGLLSSAGNTEPTLIVKQYADSIVVSYDFTSAKIINDNLFEGTIWWQIDGFSVNDTPGDPALPVKLDSYEVPNNCSASVSLIASSYVDFNYELTPARQPLIDSGNESYTKSNVLAITSYSGFEPYSVIDATETQIYRNTLIQKVRVFPIQYDNNNKKVRAYTHLKYKITFTANTSTISSPLVDETNHMMSTLSVTSNNTRQDYLIITTPKYLEAATKFADWKKLMGFNVHLEASDSWTPSSIKTTVLNTYQSYPNLYYLLIIGDNEDVPSQYSSHLNTHITDLYYGCLDGESDYTPDIYRGRLSVSTLAEANIIVDKIINYEQNPPTTTSFYNTGLNCAYFQDGDNEKDPLDTFADRRFAQTSEDIRNYLMSQGKDVERIYYAKSHVTPMFWNNGTYSNGEPIPSELLKPAFAWNGNSSDIINSINNGRFYVLHRDHGNTTCWGDPYFSTNHINLLSNGSLLPIVFSLNCQTGKFNMNGICFTEAFLRKQNGGCVAIYGATELSYSGYNDALAAGMFDAIWNSPGLRIKFGYAYPYGEDTPTPTFRLGQILDQGLNRMQETFGAYSPYYSKYQREIFHCFGDPSMRIYTSQPTSFSNVDITRNNGAITVSLNGTPADITFYNHYTGEVLCTHGTNGSYSAQFPQYVSVCVSDHNKIPYIDNGVIPTHIYIQNENITSNDTYDADFITIGSSVTNQKPSGDVTIQGGNVTMSASKYTIQPNFSISNNSEIRINIK